MFEGLKAMGDMIKSGIANFKACEKMDALTEKARNDFKDKHRPADNAFYLKYKKASEKAENAPDTLSDDEKTALSDAREAAQVVYLSTLVKNDTLPEDFRNEIRAVLEDYQKNTPSEIFERCMMRYAKTDKEKEEMKQLIQDATK
ncbi:MAG: hypothetical protein IJ644_00415 [Oscillospiraceae bacterium]|nr:hypothetical protein [Oscillospiraceae bacterium]